jgi:hypothetical protein
LTHHASSRFWACYRALPRNIQELADTAFQRLKQDPYHPSLRFKKIGRVWSARVGNHHRALAIDVGDGLLWFWIGTHSDYDTLLSPRSGLVREAEAMYGDPQGSVIGESLQTNR